MKTRNRQTKSARGRPGSNIGLHVVWFDQGLSQLAVNIRNIPTGSEWQQHSMAVTAPENAAFADVYASVASEKDKVWIAHPSFIELPAYDSQVEDADLPLRKTMH